MCCPNTWCHRRNVASAIINKFSILLYQFFFGSFTSYDFVMTSVHFSSLQFPIISLLIKINVLQKWYYALKSPKLLYIVNYTYFYGIYVHLHTYTYMLLVVAYVRAGNRYAQSVVKSALLPIHTYKHIRKEQTQLLYTQLSAKITKCICTYVCIYILWVCVLHTLHCMYAITLTYVCIL